MVGMVANEMPRPWREDDELGGLETPITSSTPTSRVFA